MRSASQASSANHVGIHARIVAVQASRARRRGDFCVFRPHLGTRSGVTWARIPAAPGHGFRSTWAAVPKHLGTDSGALGQVGGAQG